ncbi:MAG TPA: YozE family protein [Chitinophagaceae bacterium]|nr:YozE family protein [Chitinophagaceae bacterium]
MTLIEFIKSQLSKDSPLGDLAQDIQGDKEFPADKTEEEMLSYIEFKTRWKGNTAVYNNLVKAYKLHKNKVIDPLNLDANFVLLKSERWKFYKEHFPVDKVILVGSETDFYKAYCVDSSNGKALFFDIKSEFSLNDIDIVDEERIHIGNLTEQVSVEKAIELLEGCNYPEDRKPEEKRFSELIEFLQANEN